MAKLLVLFVMAVVANAQQGAATLYNLTHPYTSIEVGDQVQVSIIGAAPNGAVTVTLDGTNYYMGQTDPYTGDAFYQGIEQVSNVGNHTETWYVNGKQVAYNNPGWPYVAWAPLLPVFTVYNTFSGKNCAPITTQTSQCSSNTITQWAWSPITAYSYSSIVQTPGNLDNAISDWNNAAQGYISLSNDAYVRQDISIFDNNSLGYQKFAVTLVWGQDCFSCLNNVDLCDGACLNSSTVFGTEVDLNDGEITNLINAIGSVGYYDPAGVTLLMLDHEFGHVLRLNDVGLDANNNFIGTGGCTEAQDVMYEAPSSVYLCGIRGPTSYCDTGAIMTVYPSGVPVCPASMGNYCDGTPCQ